MKRIFLFLGVALMSIIQSCSGPEGPQGPRGSNGQDGLIAEVFEVTKSFTSTNNFSNLVTFPHVIYPSDMVLVYRLASVYQGADVWKLLPETYYQTNGALDFGYNFDFTKYDANIYLFGNNLQTVTDQFRLDQVLRIVIVPGAFSGKSTKSVDFSDYNAVIKYYNIDESHIKVLNR